MTAANLYLPLAAGPTADEVKPGWVALVIVLAMGVALALLMWSMVKQFRKVDFDEDATVTPPRSRDTGTDADGARAGDERKANGSTPA